MALDSKFTDKIDTLGTEDLKAAKIAVDASVANVTKVLAAAADADKAKVSAKLAYAKEVQAYLAAKLK
jgi:hypothetical protein